MYYTIVDCFLGRLLIAANKQGLCRVSLGDSDGDLKTALLDDYPSAELNLDDTSLNSWISEIMRYLKGQRLHLNIPLDVQATPFQWRVWEKLRAIPYGSTCSYGIIAQDLGCPNAVRAVGRACATNPVAIVIPCHRVVQKNGSIGGYRWGLKRKEALLEQERQILAAETLNFP